MVVPENKRNSICLFFQTHWFHHIFESSELLIQCGFIWKETMQLVSGKVDFNTRQVSLLWHNSFFVSLWTFQPPSYKKCMNVIICYIKNYAFIIYHIFIDQTFVSDSPKSWFDPANWAGPNGPVAVDTESVPCQHDQVNFPTQKLFYVGLDLSATVGTLTFSGQVRKFLEAWNGRGLMRLDEQSRLLKTCCFCFVFYFFHY